MIGVSFGEGGEFFFFFFRGVFTCGDLCMIFYLSLYFAF